MRSEARINALTGLRATPPPKSLMHDVPISAPAAIPNVPTDNQWQAGSTEQARYSPGNILYTILAISGFVLDHLTWTRTLLMGGSVLFAWYGLPYLTQPTFALVYAIDSMLFYLVFISVMLSRHGQRLGWIRTYGEEAAFRRFEGWLSVAFFHNAVSLTHLSEATANTGFWPALSQPWLGLLAGTLLVVGTLVKIWSALVVGVPVYYWKDMFLGRPVSAFVVSGPYRWLANPMYGVGQLPVYAIALYHQSGYGLLAAAVNQLAVFGFYYWAEKPFIQRTYR
jgi:hypothetical protein